MPASQRLRRDSLGVVGSSCARLFAATLSDDTPRGVEVCTGADVLRAGACTDFPKITCVVRIIFGSACVASAACSLQLRRNTRTSPSAFDRNELRFFV